VRDDAARADDGAIADRDTGADDRSAANPAVGADGDGARMLAARAARAKASLEEAQALAAALSAKPVVVAHKAGADGRLFGSVTNANVAEALHKAGFASVQKSMIRMPEGHIKTIGEHPVQVALHTDVLVDITINVVGETA